ncbi:MAG TPA: hypothetical protein VMI54_08825 [Polyangiaceae bacterium]|nr:hypothetical protein [Polyangiaceae bacterium]
MKAQNTWILAAAVGLGLAVATPAHAQARVDTVEYTGPDRGLLHSGIWTLGLSYVPALVVGIESSLPDDRFLFAPVAGPWIDFAKRDCPTCNHEQLNKVLLVTDGIVQGVGALEIVGSFFFIEHTTVSRTADDDGDKPKSAFELHVVPTRVAGAYGLAAIGKF